MAIAAAFHDLGIWTAGTFDYLEPSSTLATSHLVAADRSDWIPVIEAMAREHHKLTPWRREPDWLVEPFRKADWVDILAGHRPVRSARGVRSRVFAAFSAAGSASDCRSCGTTLCCDNSPNRHATAHARTSGHPVLASAEPGERWMYCYPDDAFAGY